MYVDRYDELHVNYLSSPLYICYVGYKQLYICFMLNKLCYDMLCYVMLCYVISSVEVCNMIADSNRPNKLRNVYTIRSTTKVLVSLSIGREVLH